MNQVFASACCGGGFAMPSLITGDDKAMFTTSYSISKLDTDVTDSGVWIKRSEDQNISKTIKLDMSAIFLDLYQAGLSIPIISREQQGRNADSSSGLGDISTLLGYEYLPDWDYNPFRPKAVGFLSLTLPTGKSIQESEKLTGIDSRGRGFWVLGLGTTLTKSWTRYDMNSTFEVHKSFDKAVHTESIDGAVQPGFGGSSSLGAGYNMNNLRFGTAISWVYEDPIKVTGSLNVSDGAVERFATGQLMASYVFENAFAATISYSDQTISGDPTRTTLSKVIAISLQKRWAR